MFKKYFAVFLSVIMVLTMVPQISFAQNGEKQNGEEQNQAELMLMESKIELGDYVQMGTYYGEPILWRCVAFYKVDSNGNVDLTDTTTTYKEGYQPLMLSDKILCLKAFDAPGDVTTPACPACRQTGRQAGGSHSRGYPKDGVKGYYRQETGSIFWGDSNIRCWLNSEASAGNVVWSCGNPPDETHVLGGLNEYDKEA